MYVFHNTLKTKGGPPILTHEKHGQLGPLELKALIEQSLDADKALDIVTIDLGNRTALADYIIVASGTSSRHVKALAEKLKDRLAARGVKNIRMEGLAQSDWVALDAGDIIVHLFRPEVRAFYNMEKMWSPCYSFDTTDRQLPA